MRRQKAFLLVLLALAGLLGFSSGAQALSDSQWIKGSDGSWSEAASWSTNPTIPDGGGYRAIIDNLTSNVTVSLSSDRSVGGLWVTSGDQLKLNGYQLALNGSATVDNAGQITLTGGNSRLLANGSVATLQGAGMVYMGGDSNNRLTGTGFINALGHTIKGGGNLDAPVTNNGSITADASHTLVINNNLTNSGTLGTEGSGVLQINGVAVTNNPGGTIQPGVGLVNLNGVVLGNPTFGSGQVGLTADSQMSGNIGLNAGTQVSINGHQLALNNNAVVDNPGLISLTGGNSRLNANGTVATLQGAGTVYMGGDQNNHLTGSGFINALGHTIKGGGVLDTGFANNGSIIADKDHTLVVNGNMTNTGTLSTEDNGVLQLNGVTVTNSGGTIQPGLGQVNLNGVVLGNPTFGSGQVGLTADSQMSGSIGLNASTQVSINGHQLALNNNAVVDNPGLISLTGGNSRLNANGTVATLQGAGKVYLGGDSNNHLTGSGFINALGHTIKGGGVLDTGFTNNGSIIADKNHTLVVNGNMTNTGTLSTEDNGVLQLNGVTVTNSGGTIQPGLGLVRLNGVVLGNPTFGSGQVGLSADSQMSGNIGLNAGTQVSINGQQLALNNNAVVDNPGLISLTGGNSRLLANGTVATLQGTGTVYLGGDSNNHLTGSGFINALGHTIKGGGGLDTGFTNNGSIIADKDHTLVVNGNMTNTGTLSTEDNGVLQLNGVTVTNSGGTIQPGLGLVKLNGVVLGNPTFGSGQVGLSANSQMSGNIGLNAGTQVSINGNQLALNNSAVVDNPGVITLTGGNSRLLANGSVATLQGTGMVYMGGDSNNHLIGSGFTNAADHSIVGGGSIETAVTNNGTIRGDAGHTLQLYGQITGTGNVVIDDNGAINLHNYTLQAGNLNMSQLANLIVQDNLKVGLSKDFVFAQQATSKWQWGNNTTLAMNGGGGGGGAGQRLEIGGYDSGNNATGFSSNFNLIKLSVNGSGNTVFLSDWIDNNHRGGTGGADEALYVGSLNVQVGDTLNLNGLHLYTHMGTSIHLVTMADDEASWLGGGHIIDQYVNPVPLPSSLLLLGSGLLGLGSWRRYRKG